jgi:hypothetical protein
MVGAMVGDAESQKAEALVFFRYTADAAFDSTTLRPSIGFL